MSEPVLSCHQVHKTFKDGVLTVEVLKGIDFLVHPGEQVSIVGPSGSGKSTFLHVLGGLDHVTSGSIKISGTDLTTLNETQLSLLRNRYLGFVYQFHHLLPEFTALENVAIPLLIRGTQIDAARKKAMHLLDQVGLIQRQHHKLGQLSGGERQRIAIARALVTDPVCLIADEPTGNLDSETAAQVYQTLIALNKTHNTALIIVTHDKQLARQMHRVLTMQDGRLID